MTFDEWWKQPHASVEMVGSLEGWARIVWGAGQADAAALLHEAVKHLEEHRREYHHESPPELIQNIRELLNKYGV